jgi:hypothetical protein
MRKHAIDVVAMTAGCVFLAIVAVWAVAKAVTIDLPSKGWLAAGLLVVLGIAGLAAALRPNRS